MYSALVDDIQTESYCKSTILVDSTISVNCIVNRQNYYLIYPFLENRIENRTEKGSRAISSGGPLEILCYSKFHDFKIVMLV